MNLIHLRCQVTEAIADKDPRISKAEHYFLEPAAVDKASAISSLGGKQGSTAQNSQGRLTATEAELFRVSDSALY